MKEVKDVKIFKDEEILKQDLRKLISSKTGDFLDSDKKWIIVKVDIEHNMVILTSTYSTEVDGKKYYNLFTEQCTFNVALSIMHPNNFDKLTDVAAMEYIQKVMELEARERKNGCS